MQPAYLAPSFLTIMMTNKQLVPLGFSTTHPSPVNYYSCFSHPFFASLCGPTTQPPAFHFQRFYTNPSG